MTIAELEPADTSTPIPGASTIMKALVPVELSLEKLWDRNVSITTRLVDTVTTPMLLKVVRPGKLRPAQLVTHRFAMTDIMKAYDTFGNVQKRAASK